MQPFPGIKDARYFQILFQGIFLSYGILWLHWNNDITCFIIYLTTSLATQVLCELSFTNYKLTALPFYRSGTWKSAFITALGLCLLLRTTHWYFSALAAFLSIASKYIFKWKGKHIFNPSVFGISSTILITGEGWTSPGQWGSGIVIFFMVCTLGFIVVSRVQKLDISVTFLSIYISLLFSRQILFLGWPLDFFIQSTTTGSLLLFSFFMVSDPKTTPNHPIARILYAIILAAIAFYLSAYKFVNAAPVWALLFASPLVPVLDSLFIIKRFQWISGYKLSHQKINIS